MKKIQKSSLKRKFKVPKKEAEKYILEVATDIISRSGGTIDKQQGIMEVKIEK